MSRRISTRLSRLECMKCRTDPIYSVSHDESGSYSARSPSSTVSANIGAIDEAAQNV
ncbi:MAG TPA: hypothetical protein VKY19_26720 [Ktedonosporobacter sp.]|nr:hypothetical protein [Ktedonosporobacter sp.]